MKKLLCVGMMLGILSGWCVDVQFSIAEKMKHLGEDIPVQPKQRMRLTVTARVAAGNCIETLPQIAGLQDSAVWAPDVIPFKLPFIFYEFRTADNKLRKNELYSPKRITVGSSEFRDYIFEFYVPDDAAFLRILCHANGPGNTLEVKAYELATVDQSKEKYLNINPDFKLGRNPAGYYMDQAQMHFLQDGQVEINQGWSVSDYIPVTPGQRLKVSFAGKVPEDVRDIVFTTSFFKNTVFNPKENVGQNKLPMVLRKNETEGSGEVTVPEGASWMRLVCGRGTIRYIRVEAAVQE